MTMEEFIEVNREELIARLKEIVPNTDITDDEELHLWILNDESLYLWAIDEGVDP